MPTSRLEVNQIGDGVQESLTIAGRMAFPTMVVRSVRLGAFTLLARCCCTRAFVVEPRYRAGVTSGPGFPNVGKQSLWQREKGECVVRHSNGINEGAPADDNNIALNEPADDVLPKYNDGDSAVSVLSNRYFYHKDMFRFPSLQELIQPGLVAAFGGMTVGEVRRKYTKAELMKNAESALMAPSKVVQFIDQGETLEDKLHNRIISFGSRAEIAVIEGRFTPLESSAVLLQSEIDRFHSKQTVVDPISSRSDPAFFVLGSSGSGKSFFAVKYAATFALPKFANQQNTTWYLKPGNLFIAGNLSAENLVNRMKKDILKELDRATYEKLDMHVSIVIDEAGDRMLGGFFESKENVSNLLKLMEDLATSVRLVICGTGLTTMHIDSDTDACKFRMQPWGRQDFDTILADRFKFDEATRKGVIGAITEQPSLNALATNGRSAFYLFWTISSLRSIFGAPISRSTLRGSVVSEIVGAVVRRYIGENRIHNLSDGERRRVAAWVLRALRTATTESKPEVPTFSGLTEIEKVVAMALIDLNVDYSGKEAKIIRGGLSSVLATPAISLLLCLLLGVPATFFSRWSAQEQITGLHALGAQAVHYVDQYWKDREALKQPRNPSTFDGELKNREKELSAAEKVLSAKLDKQLADLELVDVAIPVPSENIQGTICVPWLKENDIWVNGDGAPFAEVIAPYILYKCKRFSETADLVTFDLTEELWKCGLLKNDSSEGETSGQIVLRWLVGVWSGAFKDATKPVSQTKSAGVVRRTEEQHLKSAAYPYNVLDTPTSVEEVSYRTIKQSRKTGGWTIDDKALPPDLPADTRITFVISTNAAQIILSGMVEMVKEKQADGTVIEREELVEYCVTAEDLDEEGRVVKERLNEQQKRVWSQLEAKFRCSVELKFLLT
jgi:hypothetical protein